MTARPFRIVAALDGSEYESIVLLHALDLAARHPAADLHFISVVPPGTNVDNAVRDLGGRALPAFDGFDATEWRVRMHVRTGDAGDEICGLAAELRADTIVVGRFGLHHPSSGRRSIASRVVDGATCPVLVVGFAAEEVHADDRDCEDCVRVRAETDGERWFCEAHRARDRASIAPMIVDGVWTTGGLMW